MIELKDEFWNSFKCHSGWLAEVFINVSNDSLHCTGHFLL